MTAVQDGPTSITVTWTASSDATGYRISYNSSEGDSGNNHTLTGQTRRKLLNVDQFKSVQVQHGNANCEVFAVAFATAHAQEETLLS